MAIGMPAGVWHRIISGDPPQHAHGHGHGHEQDKERKGSVTSRAVLVRGRRRRRRRRRRRKKGRRIKERQEQLRQCSGHKSPRVSPPLLRHHPIFVMAKGLPSRTAVYQYLFFVSTERLPEASKCHLVEIFERRMDSYKWVEHLEHRALEEAKGQRALLPRQGQARGSRSRSPAGMSSNSPRSRGPDRHRLRHRHRHRHRHG